MDASVPPSAGPTDDDSLTGLPGQVAARAWLDAAAARAPVQAMLLGLPRLGSVNLAYGIAAGDRALAVLGRRLRAFAGDALGDHAEPPLVARVGGGQLLLASCLPASRERWQGLAEAAIATLSAPIPSAGGLRLAPRIALLRGTPGEGAAVLLDRLDQALASLARRSGQRVLWADGSHRARGISATRLEADLASAIEGRAERGGIRVLFQPQFAVADGRLTGAEALVRWDHPQLGRIGAESLFALAERSDSVVALSRHIAQVALASARDWIGPLRLSLNVTAADLADSDFVPAMTALLAEAGADPAAVTLELTEQTLVGDTGTAAARLRAMAELGCGIALDDFGSGFANFRLLKALPLDALKLDATLVRDLAHDPRDAAILRAIVAMARALGLKVVAEGVETEAQLAVLRENGCDVFQGYLRSAPLEAREMAGLAGGVAG